MVWMSEWHISGGIQVKQQIRPRSVTIFRDITFQSNTQLVKA
jgi:hypothetical protein